MENFFFMSDEKTPCRIFHHDPNWTPNDYDLYFDYNSIPVNIDKDGTHDLTRRLQKHLPLTKNLHLNFENSTVPEQNSFNLHTTVHIHFTSKSDKKEKEIRLL